MENKQNQEFDQSLFEFVTDHQDRIEDIQGHSLSFWQDARHRFVKIKQQWFRYLSLSFY